MSHAEGVYGAYSASMGKGIGMGTFPTTLAIGMCAHEHNN